MKWEYHGENTGAHANPKLIGCGAIADTKARTWLQHGIVQWPKSAFNVDARAVSVQRE